MTGTDMVRVFQSLSGKQVRVGMHAVEGMVTYTFADGSSHTCSSDDCVEVNERALKEVLG